MADTVPVHFVNQFNTNVRLLAQRMSSPVWDTIRTKPLTGEEMTFEQVGSIDMYEMVQRHGDSQTTPVEHIRKWVPIRDYALHTKRDWTDDYKQLVDASGAYVQMHAAAVARKRDDIAIAGFTSTTKTGKDGSSTEAWSPTTYDGNNHTTEQLVIPHDYSDAASIVTTGMSLLKIRNARAILGRRNVSRNKPVYIAMTSIQEQDLLLDPNLTTADRMAFKAYQRGEIQDFYGVRFVISEGIQLDATATDEFKCWAYTPDAIGGTVGPKNGGVMMDRLPTQEHALQISSYLSGGAARIDSREMLEIRCQRKGATS